MAGAGVLVICPAARSALSRTLSSFSGRSQPPGAARSARAAPGSRPRPARGGGSRPGRSRAGRLGAWRRWTGQAELGGQVDQPSLPVGKVLEDCQAGGAGQGTEQRRRGYQTGPRRPGFRVYHRHARGDELVLVSRGCGGGGGFGGLAGLGPRGAGHAGEGDQTRVGAAWPLPRRHARAGLSDLE